MFDASVCRLCLVTDRVVARRPLAAIVEAAVRGGVTMVQLREKTAGTREFLAHARELRALTSIFGVPLIINDRVDIALGVGADGVHVGQSDMPVADVRRLMGPAAIIGLSVSRAEFFANADVEEADYLGIGPVYGQSTKPDASPAHGPEGFVRMRRRTGKPVMAIGGLTPDNAGPVVAAGVAGLAVVSALCGADDPEAAARAFRALF